LVAFIGKFDGIEKLFHTVDCCIVPGGFGDRAFEEKIFVCNLARIHKKPFLGICYGF
jgi:CTP synthase